MQPYFEGQGATVYHGDCLDVLRELPDASVDSVVTDPPYGLEFMGKEWDAPWRGDVRQRDDDTFKQGDRRHGLVRHGMSASYGGDSRAAMSAFGEWCELWAAECLRVLKPGGHLLAFGGTRTWHRLAVAIEDAGFEIRDSIAWMYGSGFPKSLDVSKAIDKRRDDYPQIKAVVMYLREALSNSTCTRADLEQALGGSAVAAHFLAPSRSNAGCPSWDQWVTMKALLGFGDEMDDEVWRLNGRKGSPGEAWAMRPVLGERDVPVGHAFAGETFGGDSSNKVVDITAPATPDAARWQGWGTALKPAHEPVVVARKPLTGTVAANVLEHGTGALNIDGCRIGTDEDTRRNAAGGDNGLNRSGTFRIRERRAEDMPQHAGRWPANVVLDEDQAAALNQQSGNRPGSSSASRTSLGSGNKSDTHGWGGRIVSQYDDSGGASRFFYVAKAPARERPKVDGIAHPTVKPLTLMRWLCRLVTPPGGTVLEPFAGSGTTIEAALLEGFRVVAIEREPDYLPLIAARLERVAQEPDDGQQLTFDASA